MKKTTSLTSALIKPHKLSLIVITMCMTTAHYAYSEEVTESSQVNKTQYELELERQQQLLIEQGKEIDNLKRLVNDMAPKTKPQKANKNSDNRKTAAAPAARKPVGQEPPKTAPRIDVSPDLNLSTNINGVLTRPGTLIIEPAIGYSYTDNNRVYLNGYSFIPALAVGVIDIREIKRHTFTASITARYGLTDRWDFDIKVPYVVRSDSQRSRAVNLTSTDDEIMQMVVILVMWSCQHVFK